MPLEEPKTGLARINELLEQLDTNLPEGSDYLRVVIEEIKPYDTVEEYRNNPEEALELFYEGMRDITDELFEVITREMGEAADRDSVTTQLNELFTSISENLPVVSRSLSDLCRKLGCEIPEQEIIEEEPGAPEEQRIRTRNLILRPTDMKRFLTACGLTEDIIAGKGRHSKFRDESGELSTPMIMSVSDKLWLKNVIKELLEAGLSIERIAGGCRKRKIDYRII